MKTRLYRTHLAAVIGLAIVHYADAVAADVFARNADESRHAVAQAHPATRILQENRSTFLGLKAGDQRQVAGIRLCWCPPGTFVMGSPPDEPERRPDETQVQVTLTRGFWMAKWARSPPVCAEVVVGRTKAGPVARLFACGSSRSGVTTTSAFAWLLCRRGDHFDNGRLK